MLEYMSNKLLVHASAFCLLMVITFYHEIPLTATYTFAGALVLLLICACFMFDQDMQGVMLLLVLLLATMLHERLRNVDVK